MILSQVERKHLNLIPRGCTPLIPFRQDTRTLKFLFLASNIRWCLLIKDSVWNFSLYLFFSWETKLG